MRRGRSKMRRGHILRGYVQTTALLALSFVLYLYIILADPVLTSYGKMVMTVLIAICLISAAVMIYMNYIRVIVNVNRTIRTFAEYSKGLETDAADTIDDYAVDKGMGMIFEQFKDLTAREYLESMLKKQAQLDFLQSQINPHFLYNILDSIRGDVYTSGLFETAEMIESLSRFFRYSVGSSQSMISFEEEFGNVEDYMKIQHYRFGERIELRTAFDRTDAVIMDFKMPKMTLQPLIENAISHGIEGKLDRGIITVRTRYTDKKMIISIHDNGIGIPGEKVEHINHVLCGTANESKIMDSKGTGVALLNVSERVKLSFGPRYGVHLISSEGEGTEVQIMMPMV